MKELIEEIHLDRKDIHEDNFKFRKYLQNKHQSKAFPLSIIMAASTTVFFYNRCGYHSRIINNFYAINLFFATQIFSYEVISKNYSEKNKLSTIDSYSHLKENSF